MRGSRQGEASKQLGKGHRGRTVGPFADLAAFSSKMEAGGSEWGVRRIVHVLMDRVLAKQSSVSKN